jgi:hypothetical protein
LQGIPALQRANDVTAITLRRIFRRLAGGRAPAPALLIARLQHRVIRALTVFIHEFDLVLPK